MTDGDTLLRLAALQRNASLADLAEIRGRIAALDAEIASIAELQREALALEGRDAVRRKVGADTAWQHWLATRRAGLLRTLALARADEDGLRRRAARAQGRCEASGALVAAETAEARRRRLAAEDRALAEIALQQAQRDR